MGLYMMRRTDALERVTRIGSSVFPLFASEIEKVDINTPEDWLYAKDLDNAMNLRVQQKNRLLCSLLTSANLSDTMVDHGLQLRKFLVPGLTPNFSTKMFGPSVNMSLRALREDEDLKGIYDCLGHYNFAFPGSVLAVSNPTPYAYFGGLNAALAVNAGCAGYVTNGPTRDRKETVALGIPTFSKGFTAGDVRGQATLGSFNQTLYFGEAAILRPGDYVFSDDEATLVIPEELKESVVKDTLLRSANENKILNAVMNDLPIQSILDSYGAF
jgi:regulator of RNase E activity RraA